MDPKDMMPVRGNQATMWTLNTDRRTVRLAVPPLWSGRSVVYPTFDSVRAYVVGFQLPDDLVDDDVAQGEKLIAVQYCFRYRTFDIPRHSLVSYSYRKGVSPRYGLDLCEFEQRAN
jgi:hypothetical protein